MQNNKARIQQLEKRDQEITSQLKYIPIPSARQIALYAELTAIRQEMDALDAQDHYSKVDNLPDDESNYR